MGLRTDPGKEDGEEIGMSGRTTKSGLLRGRRVHRLVALLVTVGLGLASYLTYLDYSHAETVFCQIGSGCDIVRTSQYVTLLSVPVALWGVLGYIAIIGVALSPLQEHLRKTLLLALTFSGLVFSLYLTYLEVFVIKAVCPFCVTSAAIMTMLFVLMALQRPGVPGTSPGRVVLGALLLAVVVVLGSVFLPKELTLSSSSTVTPATVSTVTPTAVSTVTPTAVSNEEFQVALAKHLRDTGAALYWSPTCSHCIEQKSLFGDAVQYISGVNCSDETSVCVQKNLQFVPTWEIGGALYPGARSLDELAGLSGYDGPRP